MRLLALSSLLFFAACGGHDIGGIDDVVGAGCSSDRDCDTRCYIDNDFPGGFCSVPCQSDNDCPSDTYCMATNGGVCLFYCDTAGGFDCSRLGPGWSCRDRDRYAGGKANVCSGG